MTTNFSDEISRLMSNPVSGVGKLSPEKVSKELYKSGITLSATYIRNLVRGQSPENLSPKELAGLSDILTGNRMYLLIRMGYYQAESKQVFDEVDKIYKRIYGN